MQTGGYNFTILTAHIRVWHCELPVVQRLARNQILLVNIQHTNDQRHVVACRHKVRLGNNLTDWPCSTGQNMTILCGSYVKHKEKLFLGTAVVSSSPTLGIRRLIWNILSDSVKQRCWITASYTVKTLVLKSEWEVRDKTDRYPVWHGVEC